MLTPTEIRTALPLSPDAHACVDKTRHDIAKILNGNDDRLMVVVGPCSIHDTRVAHDYAERLLKLRPQVEDRLLLVMRTYLEKPRTTVGWRGLIDDPAMDGSCDMETGIQVARELLLSLNERGMPCATESLDPMLTRYTEDLVAWTAIGARTSESQTHRAMASGLPMPVGVKNGTDGRVTTAIDALAAIGSEQRYLGLGADGRITVRHALGNRNTHVVLRGGLNGPNYEPDHVAACEQALESRGVTPRIMVDCSHANCAKQAERQLDVLENVGHQVARGNRSVIGVMVESHINAGNQSAQGGLKSLEYGVSVTDPCLGWADTEQGLLALHDALGVQRFNCGQAA